MMLKDKFFTEFCHLPNASEFSLYRLEHPFTSLQKNYKNLDQLKAAIVNGFLKLFAATKKFCEVSKLSR